MNARIMVVEDDLPLKLQLVKILEKNNYDVIHKFESVKECIDAIDSIVPDLILLDINLEGKNEGIQIGSYISQNTDIPFFYITNYSDSSTLRRIQTTSPTGYLSKPLRESDIINNIAVALYNTKANEEDNAKEVSKKESEEFSKPIQRVITYIQNNLNKPIDTDVLVEISGWSKFHFIRKFNEEIGTTPHQYVIEHRLQEVKKLLRNTDLNIQEIANDLGFNSPSSLNQSFKNRFNITPSKYRKGKY